VERSHPLSSEQVLGEVFPQRILFAEPRMEKIAFWRELPLVYYYTVQKAFPVYIIYYEMSRYFLIYVEIFCDILGSTATLYNIL
jgi:hypothetical protein